MPLNSIELTNVRLFSKIHLNYHTDLNFIVGGNATGKTTILESIGILAKGHSFRTHRIDHVTQKGTGAFYVRGVIDDGQREHQIAFGRESRKSKVKFDGEFVTKKTDLIGTFPIQIITPESHEVLQSGPKTRRQFLDWGVFHVEQSYLQHWQRFNKVLRQRNIAIRKGLTSSEIKAWDPILSEHAAILHESRQAYIKSLEPKFLEMTEHLLGEKPDMVYSAGWDTSQTYEEILSTNLDSDRQRGYTFYGPHRADVKFRTMGSAVQMLYSRGQQKLVVSALLMAQAINLYNKTSKRLTILVDDLPAELDMDHRQRLLTALIKTKAQLIITATEQALLPIACDLDKKVFHVEHKDCVEVV